MRIHEVHRVRTAVVFAVVVEAHPGYHARMNSSSRTAFPACQRHIVFVEERGIRHIAVVEEAVGSHRRAAGAVVDIHNPREEEEEEAVDNLHNLAAEDCLEVRRSS
jgi:hypothetical protein